MIMHIICIQGREGVSVKVLVVSDSHSGMSYMRRWAELLRPQVIIHLGDYYDDGQALGEQFPMCRLIQVPGNCDQFRCITPAPLKIFTQLEGVNLYLTHGHVERVKSGTRELEHMARTARAHAALYGHTHIAEYHMTDDGILILNPGSIGSSGGSVALLELERGKIKQCRILRLADMEEFE